MGGIHKKINLVSQLKGKRNLGYLALEAYLQKGVKLPKESTDRYFWVWLTDKDERLKNIIEF